MTSPQEQGLGSTIESLVPQATEVYLNFVDGGYYGQGDWLEFRGDGEQALRELVEKFGDEGIDAFNQAFITPEFEESTRGRIKRLTDSIIADYEEDDAPDVRYGRNKMSAERSRLEDLLKVLNMDVGYVILLGSKHYTQRVKGE